MVVSPCSFLGANKPIKTHQQRLLFLLARFCAMVNIPQEMLRPGWTLNTESGGAVYVIPEAVVREITETAVYADGVISGSVRFSPFAICRLRKSVWSHRPARCVVGLSGVKKRSAPYSPTGSRCFFRHRPPGGTALSGIWNRGIVYRRASQRSGSAHRIEGTDWHRLWQDVFLLCVDGRTRRLSVLCSCQIPLLCGTARIGRGKITRRFYWEPEVYSDGVRAKTAQSVSQRKSREEVGDVFIPQFERAVWSGVL